MFDQLTDRFDSIVRHLRGVGKITDSNIRKTAREIRRVLLEADVNLTVAKEFIQQVIEKAEGTKVTKSVKPGEQFIKIIHDELADIMGGEPEPLQLGSKKPAVILMAGLQGSGKTTTCAKLAARLKAEGNTVMLVAADVVRPAAIDQLKTLGRQIDVPVFAEGQSDPVQICKHALNRARQDGIDVVILDTAGRLHVDRDMMEEVQRVAQATQPVETLFVVDGMTGQDAVNSAREFDRVLDISGIVLTKMDGDARGGAAVSIVKVTGKPVKFIGVSEKIDGLQLFDPEKITDRILGFGDVVGLVEKAEEIVDRKDAETLQKKLAKQQFDLDDFRSQLRQLQKMGPMQELLGMMPGMNRKMMKSLNVDDRQLIWTEAMINSMTPDERRHPERIDGSRRKRIARGSGRSVQEVNQLLKQFSQMKTMFKRMGNKKFSGHPGIPAGMEHFSGIK